MTASPEKAAPIPADDAVDTVAGILASNAGRKYVISGDLELAAEIVEALADREARPSLPDSREERTSEEEPGYLVRIAFREGRSGGLRITSPDVPGLIVSHHDEPAILADMIEVLRETERARARQGGSHG